MRHPNQQFQQLQAAGAQPPEALAGGGAGSGLQVADGGHFAGYTQLAGGSGIERSGGSEGGWRQ